MFHISKFHSLCKINFQTLFVSQAKAIFKLYSYVQINRNFTARCLTKRTDIFGPVR